MSILVRNTKERECSVCHKDISPGDLYIPQCQSRSNRGVHCVICVETELRLLVRNALAEKYESS